MIIINKIQKPIVPNKSLGQLLHISLRNFIFLKTLNSEFSYTGVSFTDQNSKPTEIDDKINHFSY